MNDQLFNYIIQEFPNLMYFSDITGSVGDHFGLINIESCHELRIYAHDGSIEILNILELTSGHDQALLYSLKKVESLLDLGNLFHALEFFGKVCTTDPLN